ncbi:HNH endonuclease [Nitrosarchaeum sp.]|uniref:HNH endonuclease n=1 Tax=Nitrosarchaeum sp. TaxID=2026886 RepID=UPI00247D14C4|nr:HNH endonuclease [Nitrosarchaeum sp.]MCV0412396.1 HNH endonuclease [Nitrosarchaeum sp.]
MVEEILSYDEMCAREKTSLQKGINFNLGERHSIVLMSRIPGAKYEDEFLENNTVLIYEGHNAYQKEGVDTTTIDQPERVAGKLTQNGKFHEAATQFKNGDRTAERVKVYENLGGATWIYHGDFFLTDSWIHHNGTRKVFKFKLTAHDGSQFTVKDTDTIQRRKVIPSNIMTKVLELHGRSCHECHSTDNLTFIHTGTDLITSDNVHIVCDKHYM